MLISIAAGLLGVESVEARTHHGEAKGVSGCVINSHGHPTSIVPAMVTVTDWARTWVWARIQIWIQVQAKVM